MVSRIRQLNNWSYEVLHDEMTYHCSHENKYNKMNSNIDFQYFQELVIHRCLVFEHIKKPYLLTSIIFKRRQREIISPFLVIRPVNKNLTHSFLNPFHHIGA